MAETLMKPKGLGISSPHCGSYLALIGERQGNGDDSSSSQRTTIPRERRRQQQQSADHDRPSHRNHHSNFSETETLFHAARHSSFLTM